jgi:hypothetical protein
MQDYLLHPYRTFEGYMRRFFSNFGTHILNSILEFFYIVKRTSSRLLTYENFGQAGASRCRSLSSICSYGASCTPPST